MLGGLTRGVSGFFVRAGLGYDARMKRALPVCSALAATLVAQAATAADPLAPPHFHVKARVIQQAPGPFYPPEAKRMHIEGDVIVNLCIDTEGHATTRLVTSSGSEILDHAALDRLRLSQWSPGYDDGTPVAECRDVRVKYYLRHGSPNAPKPPGSTQPPTAPAEEVQPSE